MRRASGVWGVLVLVLILGAGDAAAALIQPDPVLTGPGDQYRAHSNAAYFSWSEATETNPLHTNAFVRGLSGGGRTRVNESGTEAFSGNFEPGTNRLIYQQIEAGQSELYFYNASSGSRSKVGGVNSGWWEYSPQISDAYIFFARDLKVNGVWYTDLLLYRRSNGATRRIGRWGIESTDVFVGDVGERWASYTICTATTCRAYVYDAEDRRIRKIPAVNDLPQYAPALDEANRQVFFVRSGVSCGANVNIFRVPIGALATTPVKVVDMPDGKDVGYRLSLAVNPDTGNLDLYLERIRCSDFDFDIYAARGVAPA
jgi:hypothetical protein